MCYDTVIIVFLQLPELSLHICQCWGSASGSICFWASWISIRIRMLKVRIRILPSSSKNSKKTMISTFLLGDFFQHFLSLKNYVPLMYQCSESASGSRSVGSIFFWAFRILLTDPLVRGTDPRIWIRIRIRNKYHGSATVTSVSGN